LLTFYAHTAILIFMIRTALVILGAALLLGVAVQKPQDKVVFLDVGQGDAILLQSGTQQVLIDGGEGMQVLERLAEEMPWFDRRIEVVIATHPDRDHLEGLLHVLERYDVGLVLLPRMPHTTLLQEEWLSRLMRQLEEGSVAYRFAWQGQKLSLHNMELTILGPFDDYGQIDTRKNKPNDASVLARVDMHDMSFLLTGDAETRTERRFVASNPTEVLDVDILKAGHHGSNTSTTAELLAAANPRAVVISVGENNRYGHPHPDVLERLHDIPTYRTDIMGSVSFLYGKDGWRFVSQAW
jgi:competence protein ComEC